MEKLTYTGRLPYVGLLAIGITLWMFGVIETWNGPGKIMLGYGLFWLAVLWIIRK
jgi:Na+/phosphate symporter